MNVKTEVPQAYFSVVEAILEIVQGLVDDLSQVVVDVQERGPEGIILSVGVRPEDINSVVGQHGRTLKALRTFLKAVSTKQNTKMDLQIRTLS